MARHTSAETAVKDKAPPPAGELKFEAALAELEKIVQTMEGGSLPLEESLSAYRRGTELLKACRQQLENAEQQIRILENGTLRDFEAPAGEAR